MAVCQQLRVLLSGGRQIAMLKPKFGFIKCCERRVDLFFHFDALADGVVGSELKVGDDVEFSVGLEPSAEDKPEPRTVALGWDLPLAL